MGRHSIELAWGENCRYGFVVETDEGRNGPTETTTRDDRGQADLFGVYRVETGKVYLVPVDDVPTTLAALRIEPTRNGQEAGIRWAAKYELHRRSSSDG